MIKILKALGLGAFVTTIILAVVWFFVVGMFELTYHLTDSVFLGAMSPMIVIIFAGLSFMGWLYLDERE